MSRVSVFSFSDARNLILETVRQARSVPQHETVPVLDSFGRILAYNAIADRDYPPVARSIRDGFAVRAVDLPGSFEVIGEVRAGEVSNQQVGERQAIEIMTGAPIPDRADCVVMVEHASREGSRMTTDRVQDAGTFINPAGSEARRDDVVIPNGELITFPRVAMLATIGQTAVPVYRRPRVAILSTGDEVVDLQTAPEPFQVRNSNAYSLAAQVIRAGGTPAILPVARDVYRHTLDLIERGLTCDLLLLSGGVSAGKYDIVEQVLADLGAEFFITRVAVQPGQPLVFGRVDGKFFFGLPGNPASTMVTFEVFARAAVELLAGRNEAPLPFLSAVLAKDFRHKPGLTRFLPASLDPHGRRLTPIAWQGSSDVPSLARANAFLVADSDRESWKAGDSISVLLQ